MFSVLKSLGLRLFSIRSLIVLFICLYYFISSASIDSDPTFLARYKTLNALVVFVLFSVLFAMRYRHIIKARTTRTIILSFVSWALLILTIQQPSLVFMLIIVATFYDKNYQKMAGYLFVWLSVLFLVFTVLSSFGVISSGESLKSNLLVDASEFATVTSLGMGNPNTSMAFLLGIIMSGAYLFYDTKLKNKYGAYMLIITLIVYNQVGSRTGLVSAGIFLFLYLVDSRRISSLLKSSTPLVLASLLVLSIFVGSKYGSVDNKVNKFLTTRPYQWGLRIDNGALKNIVGNSDRYYTIPGDKSERYPLDNEYIYILARYGWLTMALIASLYHKGSKVNRSPVVAYMIFTSLAQCFVESLMFMAVTNIGLLFILSSLLFGDLKKEVI
jgi:hypothetical protein